MSEYEIMYLLSESINRMWEVLQFWSGVSFGYMALSYVAARHLNIYLVAFLSILYVAFTLNMLGIMQLNRTVELGYITDLQALAEIGSLQSQASIIFLKEEANINVIPAMVAVYGTFVGALFYLPYNYYFSKRENT